MAYQEILQRGLDGCGADGDGAAGAARSAVLAMGDFAVEGLCKVEFNNEEIEMLITSMEYTLQAFRDTGIVPYGSYPSYEFKQQRMKEAKDLLSKLRSYRSDSNGIPPTS